MFWQTDDSSFFAENRKRNITDKLDGKESQGQNQTDGCEGLGKRDPSRDDSTYYITAIDTKRNPDLIIPGGAIKGNMYFRRHIGLGPEKEE